MKQKMKINLIEVRNHVKIILLMLAICTLVMSFISGIFIFEKKINENYIDISKTNHLSENKKRHYFSSQKHLFRLANIITQKKH